MISNEEYRKTLQLKRNHKFCSNCNHIARDHNRAMKINGFWTGACTVGGCTCKRLAYETMKLL